MNSLREVTIGRSKECDIYLDPRCKYASGVHATLYYEGGQLMYRDISTNGTVINNVKVHNRAVPVRLGDAIMIAGMYPLSWKQIDSFFPPAQRGATNMGGASAAGISVPARASYAPPAQEVPVGSGQSAMGAQPRLSKWNWGAFYLNGIWGLFNGCWWILLINMGIGLLSFLLSLVLPFIGLLMLPLSLGWQIYVGVKGDEWAWKNRSWRSVQDFEQTQHQWAVASLVIFILNIVLVVIYSVFMMSSIAAIGSMYGLH